MSALVYALALFGCSDDGSTCRLLTDKAQEFTSRTQCQMGMESAFKSEIALRADYPSVMGKCIDKGHFAAIGDKPVDLSEKQIRFASR